MTVESAVFDYCQAAKLENIPDDVFAQIIKEAQLEFPFDEMMRELHILRAIKSYAAQMNRVAS